MYLRRLIAQLHDIETKLADELDKIADRHRVEHDVFYACHTFARHGRERAARLRPFGERYGKLVRESGEEVGLFDRVLGSARRASGTVLGRTSATGLLFLRDLKEGYLSVEEAEITWTSLVQAAQAARDADLLSLATEAGEQVKTQAKWFRTRIKRAVPQVIVSSG